MKKKHSPKRINKIETTPDTLTGRGGLALFSRYLEQVGILEIMEEKLGHLRKSSKGLPIWILFKQVFCFLFDGTSSHMTYFDALKKDPGYAAVIETDPSDMASSHTVKRFFTLFGWWMSPIFRWALKRMFIWRLNIEKPEEIEIYIDVMVLNNDDASKRHGVQPTYKKVKGFAPLHIIWNGMIVDALFRGGKKSGNHGDAVVNMVTGLVDLIRREYNENITIIIRCDAGFFDEKNFDAFDAHNIGFIASGKMYKPVKQFAGQSSEEYWGSYENDKKLWRFLEFGFRCDKWKRFYRAFYTHCLCKGQQMLLDFERPDNVILTNIGINEKVLENCSQERREHWLDPETIIGSYHQCGTDELAHRGIKDFGFEKMPFKRFCQNTALYYCMLISFFLYECFKKDVTADVIPITAYATTFRRKIVDIAAKVIHSGGEITLKISQWAMESLNFALLWEKCQNSPTLRE